MLEGLTYLSGVTIIVSTFVLGYQNRASAEIVKAVSVIVGGVVVSLLTMLSFFRSEERTESFAATFIVERETGIPLNIPAIPQEAQKNLPEFNEILWRQLEGYNWFREAIAERPHLATSYYAHLTNPIFARLEPGYDDLITFQILSCLPSRFLDGWSPAVEPRIYSVLGSTDNQIAEFSGELSNNENRKGTKVDAVAVRELLKENMFTLEHVPQGFVVPPKTKVTSSSISLGRRIVLSNPFVEFQIDVHHALRVDVNSSNHALHNLSLDPKGNYSAELVPISIRVRFNGTRKGHPNMEAHRKWAEQLSQLIRARFDEQLFWSRLASTDLDLGFAQFQEQQLRGNDQNKNEEEKIAPSSLSSQYSIQVMYSTRQYNPGLREIGDVLLRLGYRGFKLDILGPWDAESATDDSDHSLLEIGRQYLQGRTVIVVSPDDDGSEVKQVTGEVIETFRRYIPKYIQPLEYRIIKFSEVAEFVSASQDKADLIESGRHKNILVLVPSVPYQ
jgi:hypothetical protein